MARVPSIRPILTVRANGHARSCNCPQCRYTDLDGMPKWFRPLYRQSHRNAERRGITFDLTPLRFREIVNRCAGHCEVSGIPFDTEPANGKRRPFAPSLDRIDSSIGYTFSNCRMVCVMVNLALNEWGIEPLLQISHFIIKREKELLLGAAPNDWQTIRSFCAEKNVRFTKPECAAFQSRCQGLRRQRGLQDKWGMSGEIKKRMARIYPRDLLEEALSKSAIRVTSPILKEAGRDICL